MSADMLIVSATETEILPLLTHLASNFKLEAGIYSKNSCNVRILITGVGMVHMTYALTGLLTTNSAYRLVINAGIGGAFDRNVDLGSVFNITHDTFADVGVTESDGSFTSVFDMKLIDPDVLPYQNGWLINELSDSHFLLAKKAITVNTVTGTDDKARYLSEKYGADIESMEGAAFAYVCRQFGLNFLQIRSVSNYVGPRNREHWELPLAIDNLNATLIDMINLLAE